MNFDSCSFELLIPTKILKVHGSELFQEALLSYRSVLCYVTSWVTVTEFNVFAKDVAVCLTITIIFITVLVLVSHVTKFKCENTR